MAWHAVVHGIGPAVVQVTFKSHVSGLLINIVSHLQSKRLLSTPLCIYPQSLINPPASSSYQRRCASTSLVRATLINAAVHLQAILINAFVHSQSLINSLAV